ncbi:MAG: translation initiation factor IF-5A [Promethearchaeota archaeon]
MSLRKIPAGNLKKGMYFLVDNNEPALVLSVEHSKSGKHGHAKNRVSCVGLFDKKKRSLVFSSGATVDVPEIQKKNGQITDIRDDVITIMDLESFETFDAPWPPEDEADVYNKLKELKDKPDEWGQAIAEYWDVIGTKIIRRIMMQS